MADHQELLKSMLQDIINDRQENATVTMHDYFVSKTRDVTGLSQQADYVDPGLDDIDPDDNEDTE